MRRSRTYRARAAHLFVCSILVALPCLAADAIESTAPEAPVAPEVATSLAERDELDARVEQLRSELEAARIEIAKFRDEIETLHNEAAARTAAAEQLVTDGEASRVRAERRAAELESQLAALANETDRLRSANAELEKKVQKAEGTKQPAQTADQAREAQRLRVEVATLREAAKEDAQRHAASLAEEKRRREDAERRIRELESVATTPKPATGSVGASPTPEPIATTVSPLRKALEEMRRWNDSSEAKLATVRADMDRLKGEAGGAALEESRRSIIESLDALTSSVGAPIAESLELDRLHDPDSIELRKQLNGERERRIRVLEEIRRLDSEARAKR